MLPHLRHLGISVLMCCEAIEDRAPAVEPGATHLSAKGPREALGSRGTPSATPGSVPGTAPGATPVGAPGGVPDACTAPGAVPGSCAAPTTRAAS